LPKFFEIFAALRAYLSRTPLSKEEGEEQRCCRLTFLVALFRLLPEM